MPIHPFSGVVVINPNASPPLVTADGGLLSPVLPDSTGSVIYPPLHPPIHIGSAQQVIGLVPLYPCDNTECRVDKFKSDTITDDSKFPLQVFAQLSGTDLYFNDRNSWLFELPNLGTSQAVNFYLDRLVGTTWTQIEHLNNNNFGEYYPKSSTGTLCGFKKWTGYVLYWQKVIQVHGAGMYRFRALTSASFMSLCNASPSFCLNFFDCYEANKSTKFEANYSGGKFGSINKANGGGNFWEFCCFDNNKGTSTPINWYDSIRVPGFFGREEKAITRNNIKYTTGQVVKIRDESISKFKWQNFSSSATNPGTGLPFWFYDRFSVYGLMADQLLVSDYNLNNADLNIKRYSVQADSDVTPKYRGSSRFQNIELSFKSATSYAIRTRCCG